MIGSRGTDEIVSGASHDQDGETSVPDLGQTFVADAMEQRCIGLNNVGVKGLQRCVLEAFNQGLDRQGEVNKLSAWRD